MNVDEDGAKELSTCAETVDLVFVESSPTCSMEVRISKLEVRLHVL